MSEQTAEASPDDEPDDVGLRNLLQADPRWTARYDGWQVIGRGAFATVVKTHCKDLGADIAVKILKNLDQEDRRRFQQEILNAQTLDLPGVVRMYSPFWGSPPWIEMEWVDGPNLKQELQRRAADSDPFPILDGLDVAIAITDVLREAHEQKIVHRDVKPANILLPRSRHSLVKLADFGIARREGAGRLTHTGTFPGTPQFGSPESFMGDGPLTAAHDVYSLGLCVYLILTNGRFPWSIAPDAGMRSWMRLHVHVAPGSARRHVPRLDRELDDLVLRCLRKKSSKRPSAAEVLQTLRRIRERLNVEGASGSPDSSQSATRRRQATIAAGAGVLLIVGALAARRGDPSRPAAAPLAAPLSAVRATVPAEERPAPEEPSVALKGGVVQIRNGTAHLRNVAVRIETDSQTAHVCRLASPLAPGEETFCSLSDFDPEVSPASKLVGTVITYTGPDGAKTVVRAIR